MTLLAGLRLWLALTAFATLGLFVLPAAAYLWRSWRWDRALRRELSPSWPDARRLERDSDGRPVVPFRLR